VNGYVARRELHFDAGAGVFRGDLRRPGGGSARVEAAGVVFAGGRFGPVAWRVIFPQGPLTFHRAEVGVRLEQNAAAFFLRREAPLDPKLLAGSADGRYGWRTFCCCRGGEVVATEVRPAVGGIESSVVRLRSGRAVQVVASPAAPGPNGSDGTWLYFAWADGAGPASSP